MIFLGKDILKKVISVCERRTGVYFLLEEMFSKPPKRHRGIEVRRSHGRGLGGGVGGGAQGGWGPRLGARGLESVVA